MCEVCATFGIGGHWTDAAALAHARLPAPDIARYRRERRRRVALINRVVRTAGLTVSDWNGEAYWVERDDGRGELAGNLNALWAVAERLAAVAFDPLSPTFPE